MPDKKLIFVYNDERLNNYRKDFKIKTDGSMISSLINDEFKIIHILSQNSELPDEKFIYEIRIDYQFNLFEFFNHDSADHLFNVVEIPESVKHRIQQGSAYLFISYPYESYLEDHDLKLLHDYFSRYNYPYANLIYCVASPNCKDVYANFCSKNNVNPILTLDHINISGLDMRKRALTENFKYNIKKKEKKFLSWNRRTRSHRVLMLYILEELNLLDNFFISFPDKSVDTGSSYKNELEYSTLFMRYCLFDDQVVDRLVDKLPLTLDFQIIGNPDCLMYTQSDKTLYYYDNSLVHIVAETYFHSNVIHMTEKSLKPILYKQPFIMFGVPHALRALKNYGFKTFNEFWDESYDNELDDKARFEKILNLIKEICSWDEQKQLNFMQEVQPILDYNYELLKTIDPLPKNFINVYGVVTNE